MLPKKKAPTDEAEKSLTADCLKIVEWSEEDGCFVGSAPPVIAPACHGPDRAAVYDQLSIIVEEWIAILRRNPGDAGVTSPRG